MKITVFGVGYVGLVTAVCLADKGHYVYCVDTDPKKIEMMQNGVSPISEKDVPELMAKNAARLTYTTDGARAAADSQVVMVCVGTPEKKDGSANLGYVHACVKTIAACAPPECVVVIKSTVPIGTNDKIERFFAQQAEDKRIAVVSNPEFLAQGTAVYDTLQPARIVVGANEDWARDVMAQMYRDFPGELLMMDRRSAEMVKYASNDFLALKISYVNEIANLCEMIGADIDLVTRGMGYDSRIGNKFLNAGIGYGGSCFPKDTKALHWLSMINDYEIKTVKAAIDVNERQRVRLIKKARSHFESFEGLNVAALGATFKPGTDDLREAPSLVNLSILLEEGAKVKLYDPLACEQAAGVLGEGVTCVASIEEALQDVDCCMIFTELPEIRAFDVTQFEKRMKTPLIFDGRNCFELDKMDELCVVYESIGRRPVGRHEIIENIKW